MEAEAALGSAAIQGAPNVAAWPCWETLRANRAPPVGSFIEVSRPSSTHPTPPRSTCSEIREKLVTAGDVGQPASVLKLQYPEVAAQLDELPDVWWHCPRDKPNCTITRAFQSREKQAAVQVGRGGWLWGREGRIRIAHISCRGRGCMRVGPSPPLQPSISFEPSKPTPHALRRNASPPSSAGCTTAPRPSSWRSGTAPSGSTSARGTAASSQSACTTARCGTCSCDLPPSGAWAPAFPPPAPPSMNPLSHTHWRHRTILFIWRKARWGWQGMGEG